MDQPVSVQAALTTCWRTATTSANAPCKPILSTGGGEGGRHEEYDWEGNLVWAFDLNTSTNMSHHDFKVLPNGNRDYDRLRI